MTGLVPPVFRFRIYEGHPIRAGFSTRSGGVSSGCFSTLNLGLHVGDEPNHVIENRHRFCTSLGVGAETLVCGEQVHGNRVAVVDRSDLGRGAFDKDTAIPLTDAMVTGQRGVSLAAFFADCVPLFFYDPERHVIGLAHAGWRGTESRIGLETVRVMEEQFGSAPQHLLAAFGPSIGACCYVVGDAVRTRFEAVFGPDSGILRRAGKIWMLDLWAANRLVLLEAGLRPANIESAGVCTACNAGEFFSHRAHNGQTGRQAALITLE
ncbi:MAG: peptidoglycan editing factor PgeF [Firmicutes bacterium]|nr:peptidoglycan editing factor PgeF [Bacillota bacterium]MBU4534005.1 peptidoglycan editing factor PgeF [Bacillota bacterium]MBV1726961.1 peptidoglycan editing factor PgeF [Desulforudis sp.]MBV1734823.1 peptidoglycan editing factor PgeF [Desulforudis sp.]